MVIAPSQVIHTSGPQAARVAVIVPLHNYAHTIEAALDSVAAQTFADLVLIVVDDSSTDNSREVALRWMERHAGIGIGLQLRANDANARLAITRNTGIAAAEAELCFFLDADNLLLPRCIEKHVAALDAHPDAAAAYAMIAVFGARDDVIGCNVFSRQRLSHGNYIDAMAMVRREALLRLGGYRDLRHGWEDYELWLRLCEAGETAVQVPEILSRYREHPGSMLRTQTNIVRNIAELRAEITRLHPWLDLH